MKLLPQIFGILAVITFLLSYQQKNRRNILALNAISRVFYIIQYIMLGAYAGATLDVLGTVSSIAAGNKENRFINKRLKIVVITINLFILLVGLLFYKNTYSIFPIIGVLLHTNALWISNEKKIRRVSFLGSPFWLMYNLASSAYGSAIGDILTMVSIGIAICRHDIRKQKQLL